MGGVDKGLQPFRGQPLALHALQRLAPQVGALLLSANRSRDAYERWPPFHARCWPMGWRATPGPLAGFLAGLAHCATPWLLTVPCDSPRLPADLAAAWPMPPCARAPTSLSPAHRTAPRLVRPLRAQPGFCLLRAGLRPSLARYTHEGARKIGAWTAQHRCARVPFDRPGDSRTRLAMPTHRPSCRR